MKVNVDMKLTRGVSYFGINTEMRHTESVVTFYYIIEVFLFTLRDQNITFFDGINSLLRWYKKSINGKIIKECRDLFRARSSPGSLIYDAIHKINKISGENFHIKVGSYRKTVIFES